MPMPICICISYITSGLNYNSLPFASCYSQTFLQSYDQTFWNNVVQKMPLLLFARINICVHIVYRSILNNKLRLSLVLLHCLL